MSGRNAKMLRRAVAAEAATAKIEGRQPALHLRSLKARWQATPRTLRPALRRWLPTQPDYALAT